MKAPVPIRVLIVDDHPMVREGLRAMLGDGTIEIVAEAATGEEAMRSASEADADVCLLDMKLPDTDGLAVLERLRKIAPRTAVLIISMHEEPWLVRHAIEVGAAGYLLKGIGRRELLAAVHAVHDGESVLDPALLRAVLADGRERRSRETPSTVGAAERLTPLEVDVLRLMVNGLTNREISERLHWSVGTVKKYVQRILEKLGASDRTQAAVTALRKGLIS